MRLRSGLYRGQGQRLFAATAVLSIALVMGAGPSVATVAPGAFCPTTAAVSGASAPGGFEIDGNCLPNAGGLDWSSPEVGIQPMATDGTGSGDTTKFTSGAPKGDIEYVYAYAHGDSTALWLDFAFTRASETGSVGYELELNQGPARAVDDYLLNISQSGNSDFTLNSVQRWNGLAWSSPTETTGVVAAASVAKDFFEVSLNLTSLTGVTTSCPPSTVFTTVNLRTRASDSANSAASDFISPITIPPPNNCPTLTLDKNVVGGTADASAWTLTGNTTDGSVPAAFATVSGKTGAAGPVVPGKAYNLSESAGPDGYTGG
ncbi:MAG: hypothetical protein HHJ11_11575, partial [Phycicoccus sp.]|nr:hypothetical protein [Phycicoccus sp.]